MGSYMYVSGAPEVVFAELRKIDEFQSRMYKKIINR